MKRYRRRPLLGVPIDNVSMEDAVQQCFWILDQGKKAKRSHYIATVNVDFVVNSLGWKSGQVRYPELIKTLRGADLITADGMPLVWLSRLLGCPLRERVAGADLILALSREAEKEKASIFLLGGERENTKMARSKLQNLFPKLEIKGFACPRVDVEGRELARVTVEDDKLLDEIHKKAPDILYLGLGNPKQELWYNRVKHKLQVPLVIGVGGAFNFLAGSVQRAPKKIQKLGLEWLWRLYQEPSRLARRYGLGLLKISCLTFPLLLGSLIDYLRRRTSASFPWCHEYYATQGLHYLKLPEALSQLDSFEIHESILASSSKEPLLVDFSEFEYPDLESLALLVEIWAAYKGLAIPIAAYGINSRFIRFLKRNFFWDFFQQSFFATEDEARLYLEKFQRKSLYRVDRIDHMQVLTLQGNWSADTVESSITEMWEKLELEHLVVDLSECQWLDPCSMGFLVQLKKRLKQMGKEVILSGSNPTIKQAMRMAKIETEFHLEPSLNSAMNCFKRK